MCVVKIRIRESDGTADGRAKRKRFVHSHIVQGRVEQHRWFVDIVDHHHNRRFTEQRGVAVNSGSDSDAHLVVRSLLVVEFGEKVDGAGDGVNEEQRAVGNTVHQHVIGDGVIGRRENNASAVLLHVVDLGIACREFHRLSDGDRYGSRSTQRRNARITHSHVQEIEIALRVIQGTS